MNFFSGLLTTLFERTSELLPGQFGSGNDLYALSEELLSAKGQVSGVAIAERILNLYRQSSDAEKHSFFTYLVDEMDFDIAAVRESLDAYAAPQLMITGPSCAVPNLCAGSSSGGLTKPPAPPMNW